MADSKAVQRHVRYYRPVTLRTLNACLLALGAPKEEIYAPKSLVPGGSGAMATGRTIYDRYTLDELLSWATYLHREAIVRHHPDRGGSGEAAAVINQAYDRIKVILRQRSSWASC